MYRQGRQQVVGAVGAGLSRTLFPNAEQAKSLREAEKKRNVRGRDMQTVDCVPPNGCVVH